MDRDVWATDQAAKNSVFANFVAEYPSGPLSTSCFVRSGVPTACFPEAVWQRRFALEYDKGLVRIGSRRVLAACLRCAKLP